MERQKGKDWFGNVGIQVSDATLVNYVECVAKTCVIPDD
jgi:hypothetical protein